MKEQTHLDLSDGEFVTQFENLELDPTLFSHEAHLRLAWIYIKNHGLEEAVNKLCSGIKQFDEKFGDGTKFHVTLTVASTYVVNHFMEKSVSNNFQGLLQEFPRLRDNFMDLVYSHYSSRHLWNPQSRVQHFEPDLLAF